MESDFKAAYLNSYQDTKLLSRYLEYDAKTFDFEEELRNIDEFSEIKREFFEFLTPKHKKCFPAKEAFFINGELEEFDYDAKNNKIARKIFENKKGFTGNEYDDLQCLYKEIKDYNWKNPENKLIFPDHWPEWETLKIFQASKFDIKATIISLISYIEFKSSYFPMKLSDKAIEILSYCGFLYVYGRDRNFKPNIICKAESYLLYMKIYTYDEWLNALIYFSEYIINNLLIPGQIESWNIISDLTNISIMSLPNDFHKFIKFLQNNYRNRLNLNFIYGMNRFLDFIWRIVKNFLHANTEKKIIFINDHNKDVIFQTILPEQIEKKYGGKGENLFDRILPDNKKNLIRIDSLFPPYMPENHFIHPEDKAKLLSDDEYYNLFKEGKLVKISPYFNFEAFSSQKEFLRNNTKNTITKGDQSVYEDAMSQIFNKTPNDNIFDINNSYYEACEDSKEIFETATERNKNLDEDILRKNINSNSKKFLDPALNLEEYRNMLKYDYDSKIEKIFPPFQGEFSKTTNAKKIDKNIFELENTNELIEIRSSSVDLDGKNSIQIFLPEKKSNKDQDKESILKMGCPICHVSDFKWNNMPNSCKKCGNTFSVIKKENDTFEKEKITNNSNLNKNEQINQNYIDTARSYPHGTTKKYSNEMDEIEKARGRAYIIKNSDNHIFNKNEQNKDFHSKSSQNFVEFERNSKGHCCSNENLCLLF